MDMSLGDMSAVYCMEMCLIDLLLALLRFRRVSVRSTTLHVPYIGLAFLHLKLDTKKWKNVINLGLVWEPGNQWIELKLNLLTFITFSPGGTSSLRETKVWRSPVEKCLEAKKETCLYRRRWSEVCRRRKRRASRRQRRPVSLRPRKLWQDWYSLVWLLLSIA